MSDITWKDDSKEVQPVAEKPTAKASKKQSKKVVRKYHTTGIITTAHLEKEFGMKAKVIRRYLRKMEDSSKPRGSQRYEWNAGSAELKKIRKNLEVVVDSKQSNIR